MVPLDKKTYITDHSYLSYSRLSKFIKCEASAMSKLKQPVTDALLIGSYVDSHFSGEMVEFKQEHPEIFNTRTGELKTNFIKADDLIKRIESDEVFMNYMSGEKQKIMVGEIDGVPFKIKIDSYKENEFIVDLKVVKDFNKVWSDTFGRYTNFIEAYDYDIELAIFQEIVRQNTGKQLPCYIAAITKEEPSDIGIFELPQSKLNETLEFVKKILPRVKRVKNGEEAPERCEKCWYCKTTKKAKVYNWDLVGATGSKLREEGYDAYDPINKKGKE